MEGRMNRSRGGSWKRGGRGGNDSGGEHRGRGRGGHYRGRGKRDHHRGRGRGASGHAEFSRRDQDEDNSFQEDDDRMEVFSRRKLESNWDRYEASEMEKPEDDMPTQRGTDYHVLLESAGDSFTQFRFSEEKDWDMDSFAATQMSAVFVDLPALAQSLEQVPLHQRLNLEAELIQVSTPVELPPLALAPKLTTFTPPSTTFKGRCTVPTTPVPPNPASGPVSQVSLKTAELPRDDDDDEELDQLLNLQTQVSEVSGDQGSSVTDVENDVSEKMSEEKERKEKQTEEGEVKDVTPPKSASVKQEMTEEDLEDWLDSMIS